MTYQTKLRLASFLTLFLLAVLGIFLILQATPQGLGLSDDSIAYIAGARSLLAGDGYREAWLASNGPATHFPPGFSSVLAFFGWFGLDPLHSARIVNAILFGLNAGLLGVLAWRMTPSLTAGLVLAALYVGSGEILQIHTLAMSEPLFIFLCLLSFWMFDLYFEFPPSSVGKGIAGEWWWLAICAAFTGMAYLTRYAGLALAATFIVAICILRTSWRKRFTSIGIFLAGFLPWVLGWAIRNRLVTDNSANHVFAWHPITAENLNIGRYQISQFLIPIETWRTEIFKQPYLIEAISLIILGIVLVWVLLKTWTYLSKPNQVSDLGRGGKPSREVISFAVALFIFIYIASMPMFDTAAKFELRTLAPVFVSLFILIVYAGIWLRSKNLIVVITLTFIILGFSIYKQSITITQWQNNGLGYASSRWYDSQAMTYLRELPADIKIYTNEPGAVYLYVEHGAVVLPNRYDSARADFEAGIIFMQNEINAGEAVLVIFDHGDNIAKDVPAFTAGLHLTFKLESDFIYTKP